MGFSDAFASGLQEDAVVAVGKVGGAGIGDVEGRAGGSVRADGSPLGEIGGGLHNKISNQRSGQLDLKDAVAENRRGHEKDRWSNGKQITYAHAVVKT